MGFSLYVVEGNPPPEGESLEGACIDFLDRIGFLSRGYDPKTRVRSVVRSPPFSLFVSMVREPWRDWEASTLARAAKTSLPTVYRHLAKLRALDVIAGGDATPLHLRHYDLELAWTVVETNVQACMTKYEATVRQLQKDLVADQGRAPSAETVERAPPFWLRVAEVKPEPPARGSGNRPGAPVEKRRKNADPPGSRGLLLRFLRSIGYLSTQGTGGPLPSSLAFRLVADALLPEIGALRTVEELSRQLRATDAMVARHLQKLEAMMLVERATVGEGRPPKRGYRIRSASLVRAWASTEVKLALGMESYKAAVRHLATLATTENPAKSKRGRGGST